jgi:hypothetical protein
MHPRALPSIEIVDRFVVAGRYREYMALVRAPGGRILYSSSWNRSRKLVEERAKQAQRELDRRERHYPDVERMTYSETLDCRIEIEERTTDFGSAYCARIRKSEHGEILYETGWCAESIDAENLARACLQRLVDLATPDDSLERFA